MADFLDDFSFLSENTTVVGNDYLLSDTNSSNNTPRNDRSYSAIYGSLFSLTGFAVVASFLWFFYFVRRRNASYLSIIPCWIIYLSLGDMISDCTFISQMPVDIPLVRKLRIASIMFVAGTAVLNMITIAAFLFYILKSSDPKLLPFFRWLRNHKVVTTVLFFTSVSSARMFTMIHSNFLDVTVFSAPLPMKYIEILDILGIVTVIFEDIPQLVMNIYISNLTNTWDSVSFTAVGFSVFGVLISVGCRAVTYCYMMNHENEETNNSYLPEHVKAHRAYRSQSSKHARHMFDSADDRPKKSTSPKKFDLSVTYMPEVVNVLSSLRRHDDPDDVDRRRFMAPSTPKSRGDPAAISAHQIYSVVSMPLVVEEGMHTAATAHDVGQSESFVDPLAMAYNLAGSTPSLSNFAGILTANSPTPPGVAPPLAHESLPGSTDGQLSSPLHSSMRVSRNPLIIPMNQRIPPPLIPAASPILQPLPNSALSRSRALSSAATGASHWAAQQPSLIASPVVCGHDFSNSLNSSTLEEGAGLALNSVDSLPRLLEEGELEHDDELKGGSRHLTIPQVRENIASIDATTTPLTYPGSPKPLHLPKTVILPPRITSPPVSALSQELARTVSSSTVSSGGGTTPALTLSNNPFDYAPNNLPEQLRLTAPAAPLFSTAPPQSSSKSEDGKNSRGTPSISISSPSSTSLKTRVPSSFGGADVSAGKDRRRSHTLNPLKRMLDMRSRAQERLRVGEVVVPGAVDTPLEDAHVVYVPALGSGKVSPLKTSVSSPSSKMSRSAHVAAAAAGHTPATAFNTIQTPSQSSSLSDASQNNSIAKRVSLASSAPSYPSNSSGSSVSRANRVSLVRNSEDQ